MEYVASLLTQEFSYKLNGIINLLEQQHIYSGLIEYNVDHILIHYTLLLSIAHPPVSVC